MPPEVFQLLYQDNDGEIVGIDEIQLLDPTPRERIPALRKLLNSDDLFTVYQAARILAAWGDDVGLAKIEELVDRQIHHEEEFAPHRIYGYDNVYDELAEAVQFYGSDGSDRAAQVRILRKILKLYGPNVFESSLKSALIGRDFPELAPDIQEALDRALAHGRIYLASQLLPPLAKYRPQIAWSYRSQFLRSPDDEVPHPACNVAEALQFIATPEARALLEKLRHHPGHAVPEVAEESLKALDGAARL
jgi:hypothetical protein